MQCKRAQLLNNYSFRIISNYYRQTEISNVCNTRRHGSSIDSRRLRQGKQNVKIQVCASTNNEQTLRNYELPSQTTAFRKSQPAITFIHSHGNVIAQRMSWNCSCTTAADVTAPVNDASSLPPGLSWWIQKEWGPADHFHGWWHCFQVSFSALILVWHRLGLAIVPYGKGAPPSTNTGTPFEKWK